MNDSKAVTSDGRGGWAYPSASREGLTVIDVPLRSPSGGKEIDTWQTKDFGLSVVRKVEGEFTNAKKQIVQYKNFNPPDPVAEFAHYAAVARGSQLLDSAAQEQMDSLAKRFAVSSNPEQFFTSEIRGWLVDLQPGARND